MSWTLVAELPTEVEAEIIKGKLISHGIRARITCDNVGGLHAGITPALSSAKVFVLNEDKEAAVQILESR